MATALTALMQPSVTAAKAFLRLHCGPIMRSEIPGQLQKRSGRRTIADKPDIQIEFRRQLQGSAYRGVDPSFVIAESAATETGEVNNV